MRCKRRSPARRPPACLGGTREPAKTPRSLVCITTLVAAVFLIAAPAAQAARSEFFGITDEPRLDDQDLDGIVSTGVHAYRSPLRWSSVESSQGSYDWGPTDAWVGALASRAIRTVPFVWGSPDWAGPGGVLRLPVSPTARSAWQRFLKAAVARYGPDGSYWANDYGQQFGPEATPLPITSWEIWNEPNLKFSYAGGTVKQKAQRYARLLQDSHDAIKAKDPRARIVLAGMAPRTGSGTVDGSIFLDQLYKQAPGLNDDFDVAALHPYSPELDQVRQQIVNFRAVMKEHGDQGTSLWITEFGWGSAHLGLPGQAQMLSKGYNLILRNREAWNVQRLFWYRWRDPPPVPELKCRLCTSAGLLGYDRTPKPAFDAFLAFTAETTPPSASIDQGPSEGSLTNDPTPAFSFTSNEPGSTFACQLDANSFATCASSFTAPTLSEGAHGVSVKAIDAAGNEGTIVSRSFTVDTRAPAAPQITATVPRSPANDNAPEVQGSAEAGSTVKLYETPGCMGVSIGRGSATRFASRGITVPVLDNTTTRFRASATDAAGNTSPCSTARTYVEDSIGAL